MKTFDKPFNENRIENKPKNEEKEDNEEIAILKFLKEDQATEITKNEDEKLDKNINISFEKDFRKNLSNNKGFSQEESVLSQSTSAQTNVTEFQRNVSGNNFDCFPNLPLNNHPDFDKSLRKELEKVVHLILNNMGKENNAFIKTSRK